MKKGKNTKFKGKKVEKKIIMFLIRENLSSIRYGACAGILDIHRQDKMKEQGRE